MARKCPHCEERFETNTKSSRKYCSSRCRNNAIAAEKQSQTERQREAKRVRGVNVQPCQTRINPNCSGKLQLTYLGQRECQLCQRYRLLKNLNKKETHDFEAD